MYASMCYNFVHYENFMLLRDCQESNTVVIEIATEKEDEVHNWS